MKDMRTELIEVLKQNADPAYREFTERLVPGAGAVIGVRMPVLRRIAAGILSADPTAFLQEAEHACYEEDLLAAIVAGSLRAPFDTQKKWYRKIIAGISNWAVCDTFCASLRGHVSDREAFYQFLLSYLSSSHEFEQRFALVSLLDCFAAERSEEILELLRGITAHGYYADMAEAWLIAECAIHAPEQALSLLPVLSSPSVRKKAIRKMAESYRISEKTKAEARLLR